MTDPGGHALFLPESNVEESGEELVLTAEVPGMASDEIELELANNVLISVRFLRAFGLPGPAIA